MQVLLVESGVGADEMTLRAEIRGVEGGQLLFEND